MTLTSKLTPDELAVLQGSTLVVCVICDEPTEDICPICGSTVCNVCQGEHENGDSCEVFFD